MPTAEFGRGAKRRQIVRKDDLHNEVARRARYKDVSSEPPQGSKQPKGCFYQPSPGHHRYLKPIRL